MNIIGLIIACAALVLGLVAYLKVKDIKVIEGPQGPKGDKGDKGDPGKDGTITNLNGEIIVELLSKLKEIKLPNTEIKCNNFFDLK